MPETSEFVVDFRDLGARVLRRWRTIAVVALLVLLAAVAGGLRTHPQYSATASLIVAPIGTSQASQLAINMDTEREVMGSTEVAQLAAKQVGHGVTSGELIAASSVAAPTGSDVLQVTMTAPTAAAAAEWANAMAAGYLTSRSQTAVQSEKASIDALDAQISSLDGHASKATLANLIAQRQTLVEAGDNVGRVIGRAEAPSSPSSLGLPVYAAGGLVGGLILGMVVAWLWDLADRRVRFAPRLRGIFGADPLVLSGGELEPFRRVLRVLREAAGRKRVRVVSVLDMRDVRDGSVSDTIAGLARASGSNVAVLSRTDLQLERLGNGWQYEPTEPTTNLVVIDARSVDSGTQRAGIAEASNALVVVIDRHTRLRDVQTLREDVEGAIDPSAIIPVFVGRGWTVSPAIVADGDDSPAHRLRGGALVPSNS